MLPSAAASTEFAASLDKPCFTEPVQSSCAGDPDVALTILHNAKDDVAGEAISSRKHIGSSVMEMDEAPLYGCDPQASIAVPKYSVRINVAVPKHFIVCASNRIRSERVTGQSQKSCTMQGKKKLSVVGLSQTDEFGRRRISLWRTGLDSP